jgi:hypothetical protein
VSVKSFRMFVRRLSIVAVATLFGTAAVLALSTTPAFAHHTTVSGEAVCDAETGSWVITWTVKNSQSNKSANLILVNSTPSGPGTSLTGIVVGAFLPKPLGTLTGTQIVPGTTTQATLTVQGKWESLYPGQPQFVEKPPKTGMVTLGGKCEKNHPTPNASFKSSCNGSVVVHLSNGADATATAHFTVLGEGGFSVPKNVAAGGDEDVTVPEANAGAITVKEDNAVIAQSSWTEPEGCAPLAISSASTCTELIVNIENPAGNRPKTFTITGGFDGPPPFTLAGGESMEFKTGGGQGVTATVTLVGANEGTTVAWENPGQVCHPPTTTTPPLPVTGAKLSGVIGVGTALVVVGAALLFVLRYRRRLGES